PLHDALPILPFSQKEHLLKLEVSPEKERLMVPLSRTGNYDKDIEMLEIKKEAYFSYILELPDSLGLEERTMMMREDLNRFFGPKFGIRGSLEERNIPCYVIKLDNKTRLKSKNSTVPGDDERLFTTMEDLLWSLRFANRDGNHYFLDKTDYTESVHIVLPKDMGNINSIKQHLSDEYGFAFSVEQRPVEVLVIKDIK